MKAPDRGVPATLILLLALSFPPTVAGTEAPLLLVANRASHDIAFVDLARGEIVDRILTGDGPHLLSNVSNGRVAATGYGVFPKPHTEPVSSRPPFVESLNSRFTLVDVDKRTVVYDVKIPDCARPHASWIVGARAYVTCEDEQLLRVISLEDGATIGGIPTRQAGTHVLSFDAATGTLASSNTEDGSVTLIDVDSRETTVLRLAAGSEGALATGGRIWVANAIDGSISVVDPATATVTGQIDDACGFPIAFGEDFRGGIWLACFASAELLAIDAGNLAITRRLQLDHQPLNLLLHPRRDLAYLSLPRRNAVLEVDLASGRVLRHIGVGIEPDGLRWATSDERN